MATDAQRLATAIADDMPYEAAAAWVHSAALSAHAVSENLITDTGDIAGNVEAIARANPSLAPLADPAVNRIWAHPLPAEHRDPLNAYSKTNPAAEPPHDCSGYALGDLYQALSVEARKGRALCQTPKFVSKLLLDMTVPAALDQWGIENLRMIDPACGTGHILIEAFFQLRMNEPSWVNWDDCTAAAMSAVHGVDLDAYAAAIAAYRLLTMACRANAGTRQLDEAPEDWTPRVAAANSLLDRDEPLLQRGQYHLVIGNPPYITVKDATAREAIRKAYSEVCSGQYSLALPFFQLMTDLAAPGGWIAQLTANSFMKREFGKKFVKQYLPRYDLRWVIDTSGAYIPGHGTPTVILVHRNQAPSSNTVSMVMGIRGEPSTPADPAKGVVWRAIEDEVRKKLSYERLARGAEEWMRRQQAKAAEEEEPVSATRPQKTPLPVETVKAPVAAMPRTRRAPARKALTAPVPQPTLFDVEAA